TCYIIIIKTFRCSELSDFQLSSVTLSNSSSDQSDRSKTLATATMNSRGGGGGRDRLRRDPPPSRADDGGGGGGRRPSRHLWVGNLSPNLQEQDLTRHFVEFGELDSVAFQPGRHFAFVNFKNDEDGIAALKVLQGFPVDGNPLKIEFVKVDKPSAQSRDEDYRQRRDQRPAPRGSPFSHRDSKVHAGSPDAYYPDKLKTSDRNAEPSEVLWIGFPSILKVDETVLRKAFSPYGEIEKISVFPGRSYAFVRFRVLESACRAKETLQGKLFGNPKVHICFAKNDGGPSNDRRSPLSPEYKSSARRDRDFRADSNVRSPRFSAKVDRGDSDAYDFDRDSYLYPGGKRYENLRFEEELGPPPDVYERRGTPVRERFFEPDQRRPRKSSLYEEPWDLPEDVDPFRGTKKLKTGSFPPERELPEFPFSEERRGVSRGYSDFPQSESFGKNSIGYMPTPERAITIARGDRSDRLRGSYDGFQQGPDTMLSERKGFASEPAPPPSLKLWQWEGTIAKSGSPVCQARAFPVGKSMEIMLPEFLDCTARTNLDMLAKHYYQAASAWVVFFVPASDADMEHYNEFMHYLGEKQRAAVAKLDDKTTLFLVAPSEFSEKVLKVPGNLSISGVVLRLESLAPSSGPRHLPNDNRESNLHFQGDTHMPYKASLPDPSFPRHLPASTASAGISASVYPHGNMSDPYIDNRNDYPPQPRNPGLGNRITPSSYGSSNANDPPVYHERSQLVMPGPTGTENNSSAHYAGGGTSNHQDQRMFIQEPAAPSAPPASASASLAATGIQPHQLAQLLSSLVGQQGQSQSQLPSSNPSASMVEDYRAVQQQGFQNNNQQQQQNYDSSGTHYGQLQQLQQQTANVLTTMNNSREMQPGAQSSVQGGPQDGDGGVKRLEATLELAATLLKQLQQGKGP
ncbi:Flowering time control protein FPA, partial [Linum grandiflorum]